MVKVQKESAVKWTWSYKMKKLKIKIQIKLKKPNNWKQFYQDYIWNNTIPLTKPTPINSPRKQYPTRNQKPVMKYGFDDK